MGAFKVLLLGEGTEGLKNFLLETVERVGGNPCPPYIIGMGVGGASAINADKVTAAELVMYPELGTEAIKRVTFDGFRVIVGIDSEGQVLQQQEVLKKSCK
ncbi:MAG: fumarate hydratase [[Pasteurella] aerogenes]|nr:fumarate hydratase [[Pasteurella] aerogenes]